MSEVADDEDDPGFVAIQDFIHSGLSQILGHLLGHTDNDKRQQALVFQAAHAVLAHNVGMIQEALRLLDKDPEMHNPNLEKNMRENLEESIATGVAHAKAHDEHERTGSCPNCRH